MATRMQQRRGTATQWTTANPILNAGEIGFESDTNKFKIGDGINHWADLSYFVDGAELANIIDGAPALLDTLNELAAAIGDDPDFFTTVATNLSNHEADHTNVHGIADTSELSTKTFAAELLTNATKSNITITGDKNGLTISAENGVADSTTDDLAEGSTNKYFSDELAQDAVGNALGSGLSYNDSTGAISVDTATIASLESPTFTGTAIFDNLEIGGALTFSGTATEINQTDLTISDPLIYLADGNVANINDLGFVANYNDGTYQHTGLVRDSSAGTWKLFKGVTDEPTNTVNFGQGSLDDLAVGGLTASSLTVTSSVDFTGATLTGIDSYAAPTLGSTSIASGATITTIADLILSSPTVTGSLTAGGATGVSGQVLASTGSGVEWTTPAQGAAFSELMLIGA